MDLCPVLQGLASKLAQYKRHPSGENQEECEHQLDLILTVSTNQRQLSTKSKQVILEHDVILSGLTQLIEGRLRTPHLVHKCLMVLNYLILDREVLRRCLQKGIVANLAHFLQRSTDPIYQTNVLQVLKLLQTLSYKLTLTCPNGCAEHILEFSVQALLSGKHGEYRTASLEIISNLAYSNLSVQAYLKGLSSSGALNRLLISSLKDQSLAVIVLSLCILSSLWLNEDLGVRIFSEKNVEQTFQLIFKLVSQPSDTVEEAELVVRSAVDLFSSITQTVRVQQALEKYGALLKSLHTLSSLLSVSEGTRVSDLIRLLLTISRFEKPAYLLVRIFLFDSSDAVKRSTHSLPPGLSDLLNWVGQPLQHNHSTVFLALDFLKELFEMEAGPPHLSTQLVPALVKQLNVAKNCVRAERQQHEGLASNLYATKLVKLLQLMCTLSRHAPLLSSLSSSLSEQLLLDLYTFSLSANSSLFLIQQQGSVEEKTATIQLLLATVSLLACLKRTQACYQKAYTSVLEDPRVLPYLSHALTHASRHETVLTLQMLREALQLPNFHLSNFGNILASDSLNRSEQMEQLRNQVETHSSGWLERRTGESTPDHLSPPIELSPDSVESSIERLRSGLSLSEMRNSDIVDIYEYKLSTLDTKVSQLEALLEAKSLSLQQSERLVAQLRCKRAESESECQSASKSLSALEAELSRELERSKRLSEREKEVLDENESLRRDMNTLKGIKGKYSQTRAELMERSEQCEQLEKNLKAESSLSLNMRKTQEVLEVNLHTLQSQQARLLEQLRELEAEKHGSKQILVEKEKNLKEMGVRLAQDGTMLSRIERQLAEITAERDSLAKQASNAQKGREQLQERVNALHAENLKQSAALETAREDQKLTRVQLEKMQQLAAMIHNLSGSSNKPESPTTK